MRQLLEFLFILIIATCLGAVYGVIHDQLTYTVSEEYYTKFKFIQFGLAEWGGTNIGTTDAPEIIFEQPRIPVSIVGIMATWWVGLFIGIVLGIWSWKLPKNRIKIVLKAFLLTITIALITGFVGLLYGQLVLANQELNWFLPNNLVHRSRFVMVGSMHNFSYVGGLIGLVAGIFYIQRQKRMIRVYDD